MFSVPSKVLTYHCASRPILAAMPCGNLAARIIRAQESGLVVPPGSAGGFLEAADRLRNDAVQRSLLARNARAYAESTFDIAAIADRFEKVFAEALSAHHSALRPQQTSVA